MGISKVPLYSIKCHARIQKRLSGERAIIGPTAVLPLKWRFVGRPIVGPQGFWGSGRMAIYFQGSEEHWQLF